MKNNKKLQINSDWYVPIILFIIGIIVYIVDLVINKFRILSIFQVFGCWAFSCVIPIANTRLEVKAPIIVNVLIAILIFIGAFRWCFCLLRSYKLLGHDLSYFLAL
ncbi:MAG: hypothetical protein ACLU5J_06540 [Christensenellales bacterium]